MTSAATPDLQTLLAELNAPQRQAVLAPAGPTLVCAGPGSGKTHTLTLRIAALIAYHGADPRMILAVTFTNRAARELRGRVGQLVDAATAEQLSLGTFHSLCARWLRQSITQLGREPSFTIYDEDDSAQLVRRLLADPTTLSALAALDLRPGDLTVDQIVAQISGAKARQITPKAYQAAADRSGSPARQAAALIYNAYQAQLKAANALDFDDLIFAMVTILERRPAARAALQHRYRHILVDEIQDTARSQLRLLHLLSAEHRSLFAVGDRAQSLYSWRYALPTVFEELLALYPEATLIKLEQNYRSTGAICTAAQALIDASAEQSMFTTRIWTAREHGPILRLGAFRSEVEEAKRIADEIGQLVGAGQCALADVAVIMRTNAQARTLEEVFVARALPYQIIGGVPFYARAEIKDLLALLRVLANRADSLSLLRMLNTPRRGVGDVARDTLLAYAREQSLGLYAALTQLAGVAGPLKGPARRGAGELIALLDELQVAAATQRLSRLIALAVARLSYRDYLVKEYGPADGAARWQHIGQLIAVAERFDGSARDCLDDFLAEATLMSDEDLAEDAVDSGSAAEPASGDRVTCITAYKAKGLEWPVVFVVGLNEGLLPHQRAIDARSRALLEEERRVAYVALTRARDRLYLSSFAYRTTLGGPPQRCQPSRFLRDIPQAPVEPWQ